MSDTNQRLVEFGPTRLAFHVGDNGEVASIDIMQAQLFIDEYIESQENLKDSELVNYFLGWLKEQDIEISFSQAYQLIHETRKAYEEFKKKLPELLISPTTTDLTPPDSTD